MKVAVSSTGNSLDAPIDQRFGRCRYFIIVDTDDMGYTVVANANADLSTSAGIQSASLVASTGADVVITGNCGPKAMQALATTNIRMILGQQGVVRDVVEAFKSGQLLPSSPGNPSAHVGGTATTVPGFRRPGRGGCGGGIGRGRGGYNADYMAPTSAQNSAGELSPKEELTQLLRQADALNKQMEAIQARIRKLV